MMTFDKNNIDHLARLARLDLTAEEKERFSKQLSDILTYVEKLNEVKTDNIEPTAHATGLITVTRNDTVRDEGAQTEILQQAPQVEGKNYRVKSVFEG